MKKTNQESMSLKIVVAATAIGRGIGVNGFLPWKLEKDIQYFKQLTCGNVVIMGRKTWESIPEKFRPLPGRLNVVLTRSQEGTYPRDVIVANSLDDALERLSQIKIGEIFVMGGALIYKEALARKECTSIFMTQIYSEFICDTFFPEMESFRCVGNPSFAPPGRQKDSSGIEYEFLQYDRVRIQHEEYQYLDMIRTVLGNGVEKGDRTGTGTLSVFGTTMRFSLRDDVFPLLTTKKVFWRGVAEELLWFISGDTNAKTLMDKGIHIWDNNGSREFLDKLGFTDREVGDLGPVYGFQWRHFGAEYKTMHDDYTGKGMDQLRQLVNTLKTNPNDRRMILSAWNPADLHQMALPPCHMFAQFYVANGELSCQLYQRSADMGLGIPFNIASYALLTRLLAHCTGLKAGEFIHVIGDCHIYKDHIEPLKEQLLREPYPFPTLKINTDNTDIDGFKFSDFEVIGYQYHKAIPMKMSV